MTNKTYQYTNLDGRKKSMVISSMDENGFCSFTVWDLAYGEWCGSGKRHIDEIAKFLANYGVKIEKPC